MVILKKQKIGRKDEFSVEREAYKLLKPIQGTVIPYFYGETVYDTSPTLVLSAIAGTTLHDLALNEFPESKDGALETSLEDAFKALTSYGVEYGDQKLDNFLWVDERVMVIDLEQVRTDVWEENGNSATAGSLMRDFIRTRDLNRRSKLPYSSEGY